MGFSCNIRKEVPSVRRRRGWGPVGVKAGVLAETPGEPADTASACLPACRPELALFQPVVCTPADLGRIISANWVNPRTRAPKGAHHQCKANAYCSE